MSLQPRHPTSNDRTIISISIPTSALNVPLTINIDVKQQLARVDVDIQPSEGSLTSVTVQSSIAEVQAHSSDSETEENTRDRTLDNPLRRSPTSDSATESDSQWPANWYVGKVNVSRPDDDEAVETSDQAEVDLCIPAHSEKRKRHEDDNGNEHQTIRRRTFLVPRSESSK